MASMIQLVSGKPEDKLRRKTVYALYMTSGGLKVWSVVIYGRHPKMEHCLSCLLANYTHTHRERERERERERVFMLALET